MKKTILLLILIISLCVTSACAGNEGEGGEPTVDYTERVEFGGYSANWPQYKTAKELTDKATAIFEGKVTRVFYDVVDQTTSCSYKTTPNKDDPMLMLHIIYEVEVTKTHKGAHKEKQYICIMGGDRSGDINEQVELLIDAGVYDKDSPQYKIGIAGDIKRLSAEKEYLFFLSDYDGTYLQIVNDHQYAYSADSLTRAGFPTYKDVASYIAGLEQK